MFNFDSFSIEFLSDWLWLVWMALFALVGLSVWLYLRTNPPIRPWVRIVLAGLRLVAVLALIAVLLEPVISYSRSFERSPRVAVLIDRSDSMERIEQEKSRSDRVDSLVNSELFSQFASGAQLFQFGFASGIQVGRDSILTDRTALGSSLEELNRKMLAEPADAWLIFTDGNSNTGPDPLSLVDELSQPVYTIDAALAPNLFDAGIERIERNDVLFAGQSADIKVKLGWRQAGDKSITVRLMNGNRLIDEQRIAAEQKDGFGEVTLKYTPTEPGKQMLRVTLRAEGDQDEGNNAQTLAVKVLKSRLSVLLASQKPDYELSFLKRFLERSSKYEVDLRVLNPSAGNISGQFPTRQADLNRFDLVVLHDVDPRLLSGSAETIRSYLADKGGAIWILGGENMASDRTPEWLQPLMPFYNSRGLRPEYREFHAEPSEDDLFHPILRLAESRAAIRQTWADLPPFQMLLPSDQVDPISTILLTTPGPGGPSQRLPVTGFKRTGPGKLVYSAAGPFWKWEFYDTGFGSDSDKYSRFLEGLISWLTIPEDYDPIRVKPTKEVFTRGEEITFEGIAYDQGYRPIEGVTGTVRVVNDSTDQPFEADLLEVKAGSFGGKIKGVPSGSYRYEARLEKDGRLLKESTGPIEIEKFSIEEFDQAGDADLLRRLAEQTGGEYARIDQVAKLFQAINQDRIEETETGEAGLWNNYWLLVIFLSALGVEWGVRKFNHLL